MSLRGLAITLLHYLSILPYKIKYWQEFILSDGQIFQRLPGYVDGITHVDQTSYGDVIKHRCPNIKIKFTNMLLFINFLANRQTEFLPMFHLLLYVTQEYISVGDADFD